MICLRMINKILNMDFSKLLNDFSFPMINNVEVNIIR